MPRVEISVSLPEGLLNGIDDLAKKHGSTRNHVIGQLLTDALAIRKEADEGRNILVADLNKGELPSVLEFQPFIVGRGGNVIDFPRPINSPNPSA